MISNLVFDRVALCLCNILFFGVEFGKMKIVSLTDFEADREKADAHQP